jgi:secreted PhoX family phosphatase
MSIDTPQSTSRRNLIKGAAGAGLVSVFQAWHITAAFAAKPVGTAGASPYGPVSPVSDEATGLELLQLPEGFSYRSFAWTGDVMANGQPVPGGHDGMAVVAERLVPGMGNVTMLIRNHELGLGAAIGASAQYDTAFINVGSSVGHSAGGNTLLTFRGREWVDVSPALGGTLANCAGGSTPWGTWLTCEETVTDLRPAGGLKHGYVFEVRTDTVATTGRPIVDMGRMSHEAVAVDPATSAVYLTEDNRNMSGLYRFLPNDISAQPGSLENGGRLQAARVVGTPNANLNVATVGPVFALEWVDIANPDADPGPYADTTVTGTASGPFLQARAQGALRMGRGEGIWYHDGRMFIVDTATGVDSSNRPGRGEGAVWVLDLARQEIAALFVSANAVDGNNPDNITVSPRGGVILCEDGGGVTDAFGFGERMLGLNADGSSYVFCKNNTVLTAASLAGAGKSVAPGDYRGREFAGACFDAAGRVMFANMQSPGITYAIWGPWARGNL